MTDAAITVPPAPVSSARPVLEISHGAYTAQICEIGAALWELRCAGRPLIYREQGPVPAPPFAGSVLAPWPNRIDGGSYRFAGRRHQLPVDDVGRGNALHGLCLWERWTVLDHGPASASLELELWPRPGYPFALRVQADYVLDDDGLHVTVAATNVGAVDAPVGLSAHPYLTVGDESLLDDWSFRLPCDTVLLTDDRLLPRRKAAVDAANLDFRSARPIGTAAMDNAFGSVSFTDGQASAELRGPDGGGVRIAWDSSAQWVQVYTMHAPGGPGHRRAVAIEPMTCAPNAFNSGEGLIVLPAGDRTATGFTLSALS